MTTCPRCFAPFTSKRPWQKFCSAACRHAVNNARRGAPLNMEAAMKPLQTFVLRYARYRLSDVDALTLLEDILRAAGIRTKSTSE